VADPLEPAPHTHYFGDLFVWRGMYGNALWQHTEHQYAACVLLAQVAAEMGSRNAFIRLLALRHGLPVEDKTIKQLVPDMSFMDEGTRRLWTELTGGHSVTADKAIWKPYHEHVERRNRIAHGIEWGDANGGQDAMRSWRAAGAFIHELDRAMAAVDAAVTEA
jgi:hypothetical protein